MAGLFQGVRRSCSSKRFNGPLSGGFDLLLIDGTPSTTRATGFRSQVPGEERGVIVAASTVAIVAIAAVVIVALIVLMYVVPRGGRRRSPKP
jgi:hypothetical protein